MKITTFALLKLDAAHESWCELVNSLAVENVQNFWIQHRRCQAGTDSKGHLIDSAGPKLSYHLEETSITAQRTRKCLQIRC